MRVAKSVAKRYVSGEISIREPGPPPREVPSGNWEVVEEEEEAEEDLMARYRGERSGR